MQLNRSQPYGRTFGDAAATMPYIQNGFYFDSRGNLVDCPENKQRLASLPPSLADLGVEAQSEPLDPRRGQLEAKTPMQIFEMAERLAGKLKENGATVEFQPDAGNKSASIDFILANTAG